MASESPEVYKSMELSWPSINPFSPQNQKQLQLGITGLLPLTQSEWEVQVSWKHVVPSNLLWIEGREAVSFQPRDSFTGLVI